MPASASWVRTLVVHTAESCRDRVRLIRLSLRVWRWRGLCYGIVLTVPWAAGGCSPKEGSSSAKQETATLAVVQKRVVSLEAQNVSLRDALERQSGELRSLQDRIAAYEQWRDQINERVELAAGFESLLRSQGNTMRAGTAVGDANDAIVSSQPEASADAQTRRLREENLQLRHELERLTKLLATESEASKRTAAANLQAQTPAERWAALNQEWNTSISPARRVELLESMSEEAKQRHPAVIAFVESALQDSDPEVARTAVRLLAEYRSLEILPVVERALGHSDEAVRLGALVPLQHISNAEVGDLLMTALGDKSDRVRSQAMNIAEDQDADIQIQVCRTAVTSGYKDVRLGVLSLLQMRGDRPVIDIAIEGLRDKDSGVREEARSVLDFLLDREFRTRDDAKAWWDRNKDTYDDQLLPVGPKS